MKSPNQLILFIAAVTIFWSIGCQRSMNGSMATGPYAPAGSMAPASSAPLIPIGPVSGATRVPPPSTGSSSPNSAYLSTPTTSSIDNRSVDTFQANNGNIPSSTSSSTVGSPPSTFRNSLQGMPINDLTQSPAAPFAPAAYPSSNQVTAVGSGLNTQYAAAPTTNWAQQPSDLLRPIETPSNAVPVPNYRGMEPPGPLYSPSVQPAGGLAGTDSWQTTQPSNTGSANAPSTISQTSTTSSPNTIESGQPATQTANQSLPWRSPTTAR